MALNPDRGEIVVVEDNPDDVKLALRAFRKANADDQVTILRDGAEALEYLFRTGRYAHRQGEPPPRVVVLDLKLPLVDGLEVLRQVKADPQTRMIPVVVMTSSSEARDMVNTYGLGANSYIQKPVDFASFTEVVRGISAYWLTVNQAPLVGS
jgi:two-component system, response regulator